MNQPLIQTGLRYGAVGALVFATSYIALAFVFQNPPMALPVPLHAIMLFAFIFGAAFELRSQQGKKLHFWQGGAVGFITYCLIAVGSSLTLYLLFEYNDQVLQMEKEARLMVASTNMEQINDYAGVEGFAQEKIEQIKSFGALNLAINNYLWTNLIIGLFLSIFVSFLLRKK
ncbi:DUF4199 domain-containing protein [Persicobacter sp. CCB-QB2]|uniref:DUF4199 domain-containing protein n=1 Tax=Persicobacter sp. CCB-QB2 TaxID=1561025 RepID=UPI0006A9BAA9|nr:DUF4199 domain-containing protein [Persicobacter sp. CCB-QB2]